MQKGQNYNHPKKGSSIKVDPIKSKQDIQTIKKLLADKPLDYALFVIGINTNLRASDLLRIKVGQVKDLKPNDEITLKTNISRILHDKGENGEAKGRPALC